MTEQPQAQGTASLAETDAQEMPPDLAIVNSAEVNMQVATAKRYPRSIKLFREKARAMALLDEGTAASCFYVLPRGGRTIEGPSARLAEIVANAWGNLRVGAQTTGEDEHFVYGQAIAWDLEANVAIQFQTRRRITDKDGRRYNDDMIVNSANAACSIALRNAIFKVVPMAYVRPIYEEARRLAVGDIKSLASKRGAMLDYFSKLGIDKERILARLEKPGVEDIDLDDLATLKGVATGVQEGTIDLDAAFPEVPTNVPQTNGSKKGFGFPKNDAPPDDAATQAEKARQKSLLEQAEQSKAKDSAG